jgi:hypothetical protein
MDRTSKIILAFIAGGLWINAAMPLIRPAYAQHAYMELISMELGTISETFKHLIANGTKCMNHKICG